MYTQVRCSSRLVSDHRKPAAAAAHLYSRCVRPANTLTLIQACAQSPAAYGIDPSDYNNHRYTPVYRYTPHTSERGMVCPLVITNTRYTCVQGVRLRDDRDGFRKRETCKVRNSNVSVFKCTSEPKKPIIFLFFVTQPVEFQTKNLGFNVVFFQHTVFDIFLLVTS